MLDTNTILVVGATGTAGPDVVTALAAAGASVRLLVRDPARADALEATGAVLVQGDLADPATLPPALEGVDRVFLASPSHPEQAVMQESLLRAAKDANVGHVVKISVLGAEDDAAFALGRWHRETEKQLEASGIPFTLLRPSMYLQNLLAFAPSVASSRSFTAAMGDARVALVDVRDVAAVAAVVLTTPGHAGKTYELTGPEVVSFQDVAAKIAQVVGSEVLYIDVEPVTLRDQLAAGGMPPWFADATAELYTAFRSGAGARVTSTVQELTGAPPRTLMAFLRERVAEFQS